MHDQFSNTPAIRKPAVTSKGGIVAAQSRKAAEVGAEVLAAGGDCVDAVIATTFALGVLEPWMSGLGGGGAMVLYRAREDRYEVIDYGMRAPHSLRVEDYPLTGDGAASDIFPWPRVKDDRNIHGPGSIAVPGVVAGMEEAHRRHARMPWKELLAPSVELAGEGLLVDWWTTLMIASCGRRSAALSRERRGLSAGRPAAERAMGHQVAASACRRTSSRRRWRISPRKARAISTRAISRNSIAADIQAAGGALSVEDLAASARICASRWQFPIAAARCSRRRSSPPVRRWRIRCGLLQQDLQARARRPDAAAYAAYAIGAADRPIASG